MAKLTAEALGEIEAARRRERKIWDIGKIVGAESTLIPDEVWSTGATQYTEVLRCSGCRAITSVPPAILGAMPHIRVLDLSGNSLVCVPGEIVALAGSLVALYLHGNRIESVPDSICSLPLLRELSLSGNRLRALPDRICELGALRALSVAANSIETVPVLPRGLRSLNLSQNRLTGVPDHLSSLSELTTLDLSLNAGISSIPDRSWWGSLSSLESLSLAFTAVVDAGQLAAIPTVKSIDLRGCHSLAVHPVFISFKLEPRAQCGPFGEDPPGIACSALARQGHNALLIGGGCFVNGDLFDLHRSLPGIWAIDVDNKSSSSDDGSGESGGKWSFKALPSGVRLPAGHSLAFCGGWWMCFGGVYEGDRKPSPSILKILMYDTIEAELVSNVSLCGRVGHTSVQQQERRMIVFGGWDGESALNDVVSLDFATMEWRRLDTATPTSAPPCPRLWHSAWLYRGTMFVFGGQCTAADGSEKYLNDLCVFDLASHTWWSNVPVTGSPPSPRCCASAALDEARGIVYITGGRNGKRSFRDAHALDLRNLMWYAFDLVLPDSTTGDATDCGVSSHSSIVSGGELLLFGGIIGPGNSNKLLSCPLPTSLGPKVDI